MQQGETTMSQAGQARPNILMLVVHDIGTSLGCYGQPGIVSPHFDRFAGEGVRFENNFSTAPYCSPSRGSIVTGKYPHVNGLMGLVNIGWNLPPSNVTDAMLFGAAGYDTALIGYQHEVQNPEQLGFDTVVRRGGHYADQVTPNVVDFLDRRNAGDKPFYARVGFFDTHRINEQDPASGATLGNDWRKYRDRAPSPDAIQPLPYMDDCGELRRELADFYGAVNFVDEHFGKLLEALDRNGLADNTIVIFTTDHGIAFTRAKTTLYDPGINTTLLMRWPNGFRGGQVVPEMISNIDLLPTLLDCCGIGVPSDVQGRSFLPLLRDADYTPNEVIFAEKNTDPCDIKRCIRTVEWKLIHNFSRDTFNLAPRHTYERAPENPNYDRPEWELYDLKNDPDEVRNLSGVPAVAAVEQELRDRLHAWQVATDDPVLTGMMTRPVSEPGHWVRVMRGKPWRARLT
jgi:N-sulfoglucosamine sulfohydrolase